MKSVTSPGDAGQAVEAGPPLHFVAELPRHDQPIGIRERKRPQQRRVDDAENRGVGADAKGERHERDEGEPGPERQGPQGNPDVVHLCWTRTARRARGRIGWYVATPASSLARAIDEWDEYIARRCERSTCERPTFDMMGGQKLERARLPHTHPSP